MSLRDKKGARIFMLFDSNGDGYVERADIDLIIDRIAESLGYYAGSPEFARIQELYSALWRELAALDTDLDGRVSLTEWLTAIENLAGIVDSRPDLLERAISRLFDLFDTNLDGEISRDEYADWLVANGCNRDDALGAFSKLDTNGDGRVSKEELDQLADEYLFSDDPKQPGNWLFGAI